MAVNRAVKFFLLGKICLYKKSYMELIYLVVFNFLLFNFFDVDGNSDPDI